MSPRSGSRTSSPSMTRCRKTVVYMITKTIFENLGFLQAIHPATNEMSLEVATNGLPAPLHPGALRYYEECRSRHSGSPASLSG